MFDESDSCITFSGLDSVGGCEIGEESRINRGWLIALDGLREIQIGVEIVTGGERVCEVTGVVVKGGVFLVSGSSGVGSETGRRVWGKLNCQKFELSHNAMDGSWGLVLLQTDVGDLPESKKEI